MANIFIEHHAVAFVGSAFATWVWYPEPQGGDPGRAFWKTLCEYDDDVEAALDAFCEAWGVCLNGLKMELGI